MSFGHPDFRTQPEVVTAAGALTALAGKRYLMDATLGAQTVNLPPVAPNVGRVIEVMNIGGAGVNTITLDADGTDVLGDGQPGASLGGTLPLVDSGAAPWQLTLQAQDDGSTQAWCIIVTQSQVGRTQVPTVAGAGLPQNIAGGEGGPGNNNGGPVNVDGGQGTGTGDDGPVELGNNAGSEIRSRLAHLIYLHGTFLEQAGDPGATANQTKLYSKDDGGVTKLYEQWSDGTVVLLSAGMGIGPYTFSAVVTDAGDPHAAVANQVHRVDIGGSSGNVEFDLPDPTLAANIGQRFVFKNVTGSAAHSIQLNPNGAEEIDDNGSGTSVIFNVGPNGSVTVTSDGTNWHSI